jgi:AcrR family transcriptional regulator
MAAATPTRVPDAPSRTPNGPAGSARLETARPRGAARREALLEAVLRIVAEVGADAVTHRRVAEEAGLPLASTTYWFNSKEHILTAALEMAAERDTARLLDYAAEVTRRAGTADATRRTGTADATRRTGTADATRRTGGADATRPAGTAEANRRIGAADVDDALEAAVAALYEPLEDGLQASRGSLMATYALLLEAARRPALREIASRWTEAYLVTLGQLLELGGSRRPREDAELLLAAADGLLIEQLSTGATIDLRPPLRRLAKLLVQTP